MVLVLYAQTEWQNLDLQTCPSLSIKLDQRGKTDEIQVRYNNSDKYSTVSENSVATKKIQRGAPMLQARQCPRTLICSSICNSKISSLRW
jgi:hypothetical protein